MEGRELTTQRPRRTRRAVAGPRASRNALPDPVLVPKRHLAVSARQRKAGLGPCEALQRLKAAPARHLGGIRGWGVRRGVEFGGRHGWITEYTWRERAGATEDGVLESCELSLLVSDVVLQR